jgi:hypothetical protein
MCEYTVVWFYLSTYSTVLALLTKISGSVKIHTINYSLQYHKKLDLENHNLPVGRQWNEILLMTGVYILPIHFRIQIVTLFT